jgi:SNF2 family DNA or RNA helicase
VFSQSKLMIDIIQRVLAEFGMASCRIDGSVVGRERQRIIDSFNRGGNDDDSDDERGYSGPDICLLTTRACGYGITLTGADRVIVFDPRYGELCGVGPALYIDLIITLSWNPGEDRQAVDRAYRIGQRKNVVVYRFIMSSSVEEKIYEKQVTCRFYDKIALS